MLEWFFERFILGAWELLVVLLVVFIVIQNNPVMLSLVSQLVHSIMFIAMGGANVL